LPAWVKRGFALGNFVHRRLDLYRTEMRGLELAERARYIRGKLALVGESIRKRDVFRGNRHEFDQRRVYDANRGALLRYKHQPLTTGTGAIAIFGTEPRLSAPASASHVDWAALVGQSATYDRMP